MDLAEATVLRVCLKGKAESEAAAVAAADDRKVVEAGGRRAVVVVAAAENADKLMKSPD